MGRGGGGVRHAHCTGTLHAPSCSSCMQCSVFCRARHCVGKDGTVCMPYFMASSLHTLHTLPLPILRTLTPYNAHVLHMSLAAEAAPALSTSAQKAKNLSLVTHRGQRGVLLRGNVRGGGAMRGCRAAHKLTGHSACRLLRRGGTRGRPPPSACQRASGTAPARAPCAPPWGGSPARPRPSPHTPPAVLAAGP